jgi:hypothetical protein
MKSRKFANNSTNTEAGEKLNTNLESLEFEIFKIHFELNLKTTNFYLIKLAANF